MNLEGMSPRNRLVRTVRLMNQLLRRAAPGGCAQWDDFVVDCVGETGMGPYVAVERRRGCSVEFARHWIDVAETTTEEDA